MAIVEHPLVDDRLIEGVGTTAKTWQQWQALHQLPILDIATHFPKERRVCLFAPHPDDEILGCGGLLQKLAAQGNQITLVSVTNGTQSHPNSKIFPPEKLDRIRPLETQLALTTLGISEQVEKISLSLTDGQVRAQRLKFLAMLNDIIKPDDILVTTFALDGHPDHEVTGQVVQDFADEHGQQCYQVLVWAWHWAEPNDRRIPWHRSLRLPLSTTEQQLKQQALYCFQSQLHADPSTGNDAILSATTCERMSQPWEVYLYAAKP